MQPVLFVLPATEDGFCEVLLEINGFAVEVVVSGVGELRALVCWCGDPVLEDMLTTFTEGQEAA